VLNLSLLVVALTLVLCPVPDGNSNPTLDRWEASLRRLPDVIQSLEIALGTLWRIRLIRIVIVLIVGVILATHQEALAQLFEQA
jgi:ABC-type Fe3+-siderophore transport system permease subunit